MRKPNAPTRPQWEVLRYIYLHTQDNGYQPSQSEIALHFGWTSPNAVAAHIRALKHKGWIDVVGNRAVRYLHPDKTLIEREYYELPSFMRKDRAVPVGPDTTDRALARQIAGAFATYTNTFS